MQSQLVLKTPRLDLTGADDALLRAELVSHASLASTIGAAVPPTWPPEHHEPPVIEWAISISASIPRDAIWRMYYIVLREPSRTVIGTCGYKGAPDINGRVEVGYSVLDEYQRRGYASEATSALIDAAYAHGAREVAAETFPALIASKRVMEKCGMVLVGEGNDAGTIRYLRRKRSNQPQ